MNTEIAAWHHLFDLEVSDVPVILQFRLASLPDFREGQSWNSSQRHFTWRRRRRRQA